VVVEGGLGTQPVVQQALLDAGVEGPAALGLRSGLPMAKKDVPKDWKKSGSLIPVPALALSVVGLPPPWTRHATAARGTALVPKLSLSSTRPPRVRKTFPPKTKRSCT
jgi:hypothetical protein